MSATPLITTQATEATEKATPLAVPKQVPRTDSLLGHGQVSSYNYAAPKYASAIYTKFKNPLQSFYPDNGSKHHMVTFTEVADELKNNYNFEESVTSTSLDILALYLKGQKILHMEAKTLCEKRLNTLMLPAILISSLCAILNFALNGSTYGPVLVSCFNVVNAFLMSLVSYLKLDAKAQLHQSSAYKYQKLEALCEFNSGRVLFFKETDDIMKLVDDVHNRVLEIKESNQFVLPEQIRYRFHQIFSTNVFTSVKDIQNQEIIFINDLKVIIQEMQYIRGLKQKKEDKITLLDSEIASLHSQEKSMKLSRSTMIDSYAEQEVQYRISQIVDGTEETNNKLHDELIKEIDRNIIARIVDQDIEYIHDKIEQLTQEHYETRAVIKELIEKRNTLEIKKVDALKVTIEHRKEYLKLNNLYDADLKADRERRQRRWQVCNWCKT
jgi:hypothetical protein